MYFVFFCLSRSYSVGATISVDYWWSLRGLDEGSKEYKDTINEVHQRAADRILYGCLHNGGLYIKMGQGLVSLNHILPIQYLQTLQVSLRYHIYFNLSIWQCYL